MGARTPLLVAMGGTLAFYVANVLKARKGLTKVRAGANEHRHAFSVVIAARNEEEAIGACLDGVLAQEYPADLVEIIVVDDRSEDATAEIVRSRAALHPRVKLLQVTSVPEGMAPKKHAITKAIEEVATGEIILATDADCRHLPTWIGEINRMFSSDVGAVIGHTVYRDTGTWAGRVQALDFFSNRALGTGLVGNGHALLSTGANLAYRRSVYDEVGGFGGAMAMISGDDDLLLQRVEKLTPWRVVAATDPRSFVETDGVPDVKTFVMQRARWSSKSMNYSPEVMPLLVGIFLMLLFSALTLPLALISPRKWWPAAVMLGVRWCAEYSLLKRGAKVLHQESLMKVKYFLPMAILMPFYVVAAVAWGNLGKFTWKGTTFSRRAGATTGGSGGPR